jgi:RNA polymerase sigma-70 factor (ECF subfamily)
MATFDAVDGKHAARDSAAKANPGVAAEPCSASCQWDLRANTWQWEPGLAVIFGRRADSFILTVPAILEMKHPDDLEMSRSMVNSIRSGGSRFSYSNRIYRGDGRVRTVHASAWVSFDSKGNPAQMRASVEALSDWTLPLESCDVAAASDGELMLALRAGIPEALAEVFRRHGRSVAQIARRFGAVNADDVVQDVFESLCRSPGRFDARRGSLRTYLNMCARTRCFDDLRSETSRRLRDRGISQAAPVPSVEMEALSALSARRVQTALTLMRAEERAVIELAFFGGLSYRAVAARLEIPEGTAKGRIRSGLSHLAAMLGTP